MRYPSSLFFLLLGGLLASCQPLSDSIDQNILICGAASEQDKYLYKPAFGFSGEPLTRAGVEAFLMRAAERSRLPLSEKGCIGIPMDSSQDAAVLVRTIKDEPQGLLIASGAAQRSDRLILKDVREQEIFLSCQSPIFSSGQQLNLNSIVQGSYNPAAVRIGLQLPGQTKMYAANWADGLWTIPLPDLEHGPHKIFLQAENLFNAFKKPTIAECEVAVDRKSPDVTVPYDNDFALDEQHSVFRRRPGQILKLTASEDGFPQQIYYCLKEISALDQQSICTEKDFLLMRDGLSSPDRGLWHFEFYAEDMAGNRSKNQTAPFLVYREAEIQAVHAMLESADAEFRTADQVSAGRKLLQAESLRRQLTDWESNSLRDTVLEKALSFIPRGIQILSQRMGERAFENGVLAWSRDGSKLLVGTDRLRLVDRQGLLLHELAALEGDSIASASFAEDDQALWVRGKSGKVSIYSAEGNLRCSVQTDQEVSISSSGKIYLTQKFGFSPSRIAILNSACQEVDSFTVAGEYALFFAPDEPVFAVFDPSAVGDNKVQIRELGRPEALRSFDVPLNLSPLEWLKDAYPVVGGFERGGKRLVLCNKSKAYLFESSGSNKPMVVSFQSDFGDIKSCSFTANGGIWGISSAKVFSQRLETINGSAILITEWNRSYPGASAEIVSDELGEHVIEFRRATSDQATLVSYGVRENRKSPRTFTIPDTGEKSRLAISPADPAELAILRNNGILGIWNLKKSYVSKYSVASVSDWLHTLAVSPDQSYQIVANPKGGLQLQGSKDTPVSLSGLADSVTKVAAFAFSPDNSKFAALIDVTSSLTQPRMDLKVWSRSGELLRSYPGLRSTANRLLFSEDGRKLIFDTYNGPKIMMTIADVDRENLAVEESLSKRERLYPITMIGDEVLAGGVARAGEPKSCTIYRLDAALRPSIVAKDLCYLGASTYSQQEGLLYASSINGGHVIFNIKTGEQLPFGGAGTAAFELLQRSDSSSAVLAREASTSRIAVIQNGVPDLILDVGMLPPYKLFLDAKGQVWTYNKERIEVRRANGTRLMSLPYGARNLQIKGETLLFGSTLSEYWELPLGIDAAIGAICSWIMPTNSSSAFTSSEAALCEQLRP